MLRRHTEVFLPFTWARHGSISPHKAHPKRSTPTPWGVHTTTNQNNIEIDLPPFSTPFPFCLDFHAGSFLLWPSAMRYHPFQLQIKHTTSHATCILQLLHVLFTNHSYYSHHDWNITLDHLEHVPSQFTHHRWMCPTPLYRPQFNNSDPTCEFALITSANTPSLQFC